MSVQTEIFTDRLDARIDQTIGQRGDALEFLQERPTGSVKVCFADWQYRTNLVWLAYHNEGARQRGRCALPQMTDKYIEQCCRELPRVLKPSSYVFMWADTYRLCEGSHRRFADVLPCVDLIIWDNQRLGMGYRSRRRGDYLLVLQTLPVRAKGTWNDHGIPDRWIEKVDRRITHLKPAGLIERLILATTEPGDLVIDPCAGVTFPVMRIAHKLGRRFAGVDLAYQTPDTERGPAWLEL